MNKLRFLLKELGDLSYSENIEKHISLMNLLKSMKQIAETGNGPQDQIPSAGCSIKWKYD